MIPYVMFGVHPLFGDYVDAIHAMGGYLARVVLNVPEPERPVGERFQDGLERYHCWLQTMGISRPVEVLALDDYLPRPEERPLLGFRGTKTAPLVKLLRERHGLSFPPLVHPTAYISPMADLEEGVFVGAGATVAPNARIGSFSLINRSASIGHDSVVERGVVVGPAVRTASWVRLREGCVLGVGCTVIERVEVGAGSYVAAGAVVLKDVHPWRLVAGVPAVEKKTLRTEPVPDA
jgi:carbonic anhydrase/acetyltransferase-like protein (isoleucine patch superfamily)